MHTAVVKPIYNSGQPMSYKITVHDEHVWIDLHLQSIPGDLLTIVSKLKDELVFKKPYKLVFNTLSIPERYRTIKEFLSFKESLIKLLGKSQDPNMDTWVEILKLHIIKGKTPNFNDHDDPATLIRISNYMESILNTKITKQQVIDLCTRLMADVKKS